MRQTPAVSRGAQHQGGDPRPPKIAATDKSALEGAAGGRLIERDGLDALLATLRGRGYTLLGPTIRSQAIVYDEISSVADLPAGWTDEQEGGVYRLRRRDDQALFGHNVGPSSWKGFLFPAELRLVSARRGEDGGVVAEAEDAEVPRYAFIGARSCDLHAVAVQDRVFLGGPHIDVTYAARRRDNFVVAVNCGQAGGTCFCVSMNTGPRASFGYDLALTELLDGGPHRFLVEVGSDAGAEVLAALSTRSAQDGDRRLAEETVQHTAASMGRTLETDGLKELLYANMEHARWDDAASRCLTCGNCTMVCPTCFCHSVEDVSDLAGADSERVRHWDSCFTLDHSYIHGGSVRRSGRSRYRQWMTHKLATWWDQFDTSGCIGCGRCITWCPVGIDITEEAAAIRASDGRDAADGTGS